MMDALQRAMMARSTYTVEISQRHLQQGFVWLSKNLKDADL